MSSSSGTHALFDIASPPMRVLEGIGSGTLQLGRKGLNSTRLPSDLIALYVLVHKMEDSERVEW